MMKHAPSLFLALLLSACQSPQGAALETNTVVLSIGGMTCAVNCPPRVESALESVTGVESAVVDYDARSATVVVHGPIDTAALISALQKQGFGGMVRE